MKTNTDTGSKWSISRKFAKKLLHARGFLLVKELLVKAQTGPLAHVARFTSQLLLKNCTKSLEVTQKCSGAEKARCTISLVFSGEVNMGVHF